MVSGSISASAKQSIKNFQMKLINRSLADLKLLDSLADSFLGCCNDEIKANTLSILSTIPLIIVTFVVSQQPAFYQYILAFIALILQQILDVANKKQAYRLQSFSFGTFFFDHICDSFSIICIIFIIGRLLSISNNWLWLCLCVFGVLPFYVAHLNMYYGEYMNFPALSPVSEGMIFLEIICILGAILGFQFFTTKIIFISISQIIIVIALIWLIVYLIPQIRLILEAGGIKNLFVVFVIGYIMFEMSVIETEEILNEDSNIVFGLFVYSLMLCNSLLSSQLIFKYGCNEKFMQISLNVLFFTSYLVVVYAIFAFIDFQDQSIKEEEKSVEQILALIVAGILAIGQTAGYVYRSIQIKNMINQAINE